MKKSLLILLAAGVLGAGALTLGLRLASPSGTSAPEWAGDDPAEPEKPEPPSPPPPEPPAAQPTPPPRSVEVAPPEPEPRRTATIEPPLNPPLESPVVPAPEPSAATDSPLHREDLRKQAATAETSFTEAYERLVNRQNRKQP